MNVLSSIFSTVSVGVLSVVKAAVFLLIAFVVATFSLVVHSDDNPHRKVEAKHEL